MNPPKRFAVATILLCLFALLTTASEATGQVIETVTFENVSPAVAGSGDFRSFQMAVGGDVRSIDYTGQITEINTATYISEVIVDIFGSGASVIGRSISNTTNFTGTAQFAGNILVDAATEIGDQWSFLFTENFDDDDDGLADAVLDITFSFLTTAPDPPTVSNLGSYALNQGTYARGGADGEYAFSVVPFQVSDSGNYALDVEWFDVQNASSFDGYLYLLDVAFQGSDELAIASNDDFRTTASSHIDVTLDPSRVYFALLTTFSPTATSNNLQGQLSVSSSNGATAQSFGTPVNVPEPGGLLCIFTIGILGRRHRSLRA